MVVFYREELGLEEVYIINRIYIFFIYYLF